MPLLTNEKLFTAQLLRLRSLTIRLVCTLPQIYNFTDNIKDKE